MLGRRISEETYSTPFRTETDTSYEENIHGDLFVAGDFAISGTGKGCIVETIDYGKRWLYAVEGPEIRLEEKGCGLLVDGQCRID